MINKAEDAGETCTGEAGTGEESGASAEQSRDC